jgi:excisionase family DNA binding protein
VKLLTLVEAADFLRMSRSTLYQRKDIPRYRRPGSRAILFDQDELEAWLKQGRIQMDVSTQDNTSESKNPMPALHVGSSVVDISSPRLYHRNGRYR